MELEIQKYLRNNTHGIWRLKCEHAISAKRHEEYTNLVAFKYNQIESDFSKPIVQEARGIILDENDNWNVVCYSFKKFFNVNEPNAAKIDWSSAVVLEKLDGSLCQLYYYDNKWNVATSGTPDASGQVNDYGKTFKELFWETWKIAGYNLDFLTPGFSHAFELTGPMNRVVVNYKEHFLHLIGVRRLSDFQEFESFTPFGLFKFSKRYPLRSIEDCVKAAEALNPMENEGFVVVDRYFNRIKIKSPAYVMLHHAKDSLSKKRMCEIIRSGEYQEFKTAIDSLPCLKKIFEEINDSHKMTVFEADSHYNRIKHIKDQKEFAKQAIESSCGAYASLLFLMRKMNQTASQALTSPKITLQSYMKMIGME
jgi:hypothetical protein